nr:uncharacterized protein LOC126518675 isoform X4 [Dermacentor andersoni]
MLWARCHLRPQSSWHNCHGMLATETSRGLTICVGCCEHSWQVEKESISNVLTPTLSLLVNTTTYFMHSAYQETSFVLATVGAR